MKEDNIEFAFLSLDLDLSMAVVAFHKTSIDQNMAEIALLSGQSQREIVCEATVFLFSKKKKLNMVEGRSQQSAKNVMLRKFQIR